MRASHWNGSAAYHASTHMPRCVHQCLLMTLTRLALFPKTSKTSARSVTRTDRTGIRERARNGKRRPAGASRRDPLVPAKGKPAFEVALHGKRVRSDEPGAVLILRAEQKCHAFPIGLVRRSDARDVQRIQRQTGGVGVGLRAAELRPAAARFLRLANSSYSSRTSDRAASVHTRPIRRMARSSAEAGFAASSHWRARRRVCAIWF